MLHHPDHFQAGLSTAFESLAEEFHAPFTKLADLIAWPVFCLGVSNLIWTPTAMCIGKRPVIIVSMMIFLAGSIWSTQAKTYNSLLGSRILATFGEFQCRPDDTNRCRTKLTQCQKGVDLLRVWDLQLLLVNLSPSNLTESC
jgi:hypothetical protein